MGDFAGELLGLALTLLGWDGSEFRNLKLDSDGHPQVDVLSSALPSGGATSAKQDTMITALQLIEDLRTTLATVASDQLRIDVISSALPTGAATFAKQDIMITALQLIDDLRGALNSVKTDAFLTYIAQYGAVWYPLQMDGSSQLKVVNAALPLPSGAATETSLQGIEDKIPDQLLGFTSVYRESVADVDASAGQNTLNGAAVAANTLHIITNIAAWDANNAVTDIRINIVGDAVTRSLLRGGATAANISVNYQGQVILDAGDYIQAYFDGVTLNDNIFIQAHGWKASI